MRGTLVLTVLLGIGYGVMAIGGRPSTKDKEDRKITEEEWRREVLSSPAPVLVDFWAPWCGPCLQMKPVVEALGKEFRVVMVNVDTNKELTERTRVESVPTFVIFKGGKVARRFEGVVAEQSLRKALKELSEAR